MKKKQTIQNNIGMGKNKGNKKIARHKPTQEEVEEEIEMINPDENTLDRG